MRAMTIALAGIAGCYSANAEPGAPCSPAAPFCPDGQSCNLVGIGYQCTVGGVLSDARTDVAIPLGDAPADADHGLDAAIDAAPGAQWTLLATHQSTTTTVNLGTTQAGSLLIIALETAAGDAVSTLSDDGPTGPADYVRIPGSRAEENHGEFGVELWYAPAVKAGANRLFVGSPSLYAAVVWEVAGMRAGSPLDAVTTLPDQPTSAAPTGAPIRTTAAGDFVVAVAMLENATTGTVLGNAFTNDRTTAGNGWAHLTAPAAPAATYTAQWDQQPDGGYCASSAAFFVGP